MAFQKKAEAANLLLGLLFAILKATSRKGKVLYNMFKTNWNAVTGQIGLEIMILVNCLLVNWEYTKKLFGIQDYVSSIHTRSLSNHFLCKTEKSARTQRPTTARKKYQKDTPLKVVPDRKCLVRSILTYYVEYNLRAGASVEQSE